MYICLPLFEIKENQTRTDILTLITALNPVTRRGSLRDTLTETITTPVPYFNIKSNKVFGNDRNLICKERKERSKEKKEIYIIYIYI